MADEYFKEKLVEKLKAGYFKEVLRNILHKVDYEKDCDCWLFQGYIDPESGYGQVQLSVNTERGYWHKTFKVHRVCAWILYDFDLFDKTIDTMHSCDRRNCVNPQHLSIGSRSQNLQDSANKGRWHGGSHTGIGGPYVSGLKKKDWGKYRDDDKKNEVG